MTGRLVLGAMMLERREILSLLLMVMFTSRVSSTRAWLMGGAMVILAYALGLSAPNAFSSRTLSVLPLDTRDINRATWILVVGLPLLLLTAGRVLAASLFAPFGDSWSWVFPATPVRVFYEFLFFAMAGAWTVLVPDRHALVDRASDLYLIILALLGVMAAPFLVLYHLPATFAGISPVGWLLTGVAILLAATPLFLSPKQYVRPAPARPAPEVEAVIPAGPAVAVGAAPLLRGLWALMPAVLAQALAWTAAFVTFQLAMAWTKGSEVFLQPFAPGLPGTRFLMSTSFLLLFVIGLLPSLGPRVPMLKLLPIAPTRAAAAITLAPTATPLLLWAALVLIHVAVSTAWPESLRPGYLALLMGAATLVDAVGIKLGSERLRFALGTPLIVGLMYGVDGDRAALERVLQHWLVPVVGVASVALAYAINLHTMTRSERTSRAYRYGQASMPQGGR